MRILREDRSNKKDNDNEDDDEDDSRKQTVSQFTYGHFTASGRNLPFIVNLGINIKIK